MDVQILVICLRHRCFNSINFNVTTTTRWTVDILLYIRRMTVVLYAFFGYSPCSSPNQIKREWKVFKSAILDCRRAREMWWFIHLLLLAILMYIVGSAGTQFVTKCFLLSSRKHTLRSNDVDDEITTTKNKYFPQMTMNSYGNVFKLVRGE